jgi:riboflavin kinase / FMN adenylyltransferase
MPAILHSVIDFPQEFRGGAISIGNFDGVHRGHRELIANLVGKARAMGGPAIVFTFDPPPFAILHPDLELAPPLTAITRRAELLGRLGVDVVVAYATDKYLLELTATEFFEKILVEAIGAKCIVEGPNFRFGHNRIGDTQLLKQLCEERNMEFKVVDAQVDMQGMISSSRIKQLIRDGEIEAANAMLTEPFQLTGLVSHGAGRGRSLGTPTANLSQVGVLIPKIGVYAGCVQVGSSQCAAAINIGPNPTFGESSFKIEAHLIDWKGELYEQALNCLLLKRLRDVRQFASPDELRQQIGKDIEECRFIFAKYSQ